MNWWISLLLPIIFTSWGQKLPVFFKVKPEVAKYRLVTPVLKDENPQGTPQSTGYVYSTGAFVSSISFTKQGFVGSLPYSCLQAIKLLPRWLRADFAMNMSMTDKKVVDKWCKLVINTPQQQRDEVGFLLAHTHPKELAKQDFAPENITDQAELIYQVAQHSNWAQLVEHNESQDNYWTTVKLKYKEDGTVKWYEVPKDMYYYFVLHPREDAEPVQTTDPITGEAALPSQGRTWRRYILQPTLPTPQYTEHLLTKGPKTSQRGPLDMQAKGYFINIKHAVEGIVKDGADHPVLMEERWGKGSFVVTTLPLISAFKAGDKQLFNDFVKYGNGDCWDDFYQKHVVVSADPDNDPLVQAIQKRDKHVEVISPDDLEGLKLDKDLYKIVVSEGNPQELFTQILKIRKGDIEQWVKDGGTFHCICVPKQGSTTEFEELPGDISFKLKDEGDLKIYGWPALWDLYPGTDYVWDAKVYKALKGDRVFDPNTFLLDKIGWFVGVNLPDDVGRYRQKGCGFPARFVQTVAVLYQHLGNCGELEDVVTAASRALLIPTANSMDSAEDHVWSEFYMNDAWHPFQVSWDQGDTSIDWGGISMEKRFGGGKDISAVISLYGDGRILNRTNYYTDTIKIVLHVKDKNGSPVDGALVLIASEFYYKNQQGNYDLVPVYFGLTDHNGDFKVELGDHQNYYILVRSSLGAYPEGANSVVQIVKDADAVKDKVFEQTITINGELKHPDVEEKMGPDGCELQVMEAAGYVVAKSLFTGGVFAQPVPGKKAWAVVLDDAALKEFKDKGTLTSYIAAAQFDKDHPANLKVGDAQQNLHLLVLPEGTVDGGVLARAVLKCPEQNAENAEEAAEVAELQSDADTYVSDNAGDFSNKVDTFEADTIEKDSITSDVETKNQSKGSSNGCDVGGSSNPAIIPVLFVLLGILGFYRFKKTQQEDLKN